MFFTDSGYLAVSIVATLSMKALTSSLCNCKKKSQLMKYITLFTAEYNKNKFLDKFFFLLLIQNLPQNQGAVS